MVPGLLSTPFGAIKRFKDGVWAPIVQEATRKNNAKILDIIILAFLSYIPKGRKRFRVCG
ncbi:MAG: hypothetical protein A2283_09380 [Lentisphaerae bacterium RIFOXYA12_FULL_48_11]|nr:MAG: hypothetical protein A2283_09380 [Lentisphaerae bacterium RIFOXYA12_FULL_48_11]